MSDELAINGGTPVRDKPWEESNSIGKEEAEALKRVVDSKNLSLFQGAWKPNAPYNFLGGPEVLSLEEEAKKEIGAKHVVSVNSASSGLYAAVGALGLGYGDEVIVSPYTMSVCATAPLPYGAIPVFADVKRETGSLDPASIKERITDHTKAILLVHQFGIPAEMDEIMAIAKEHNLRVIEDCAQAWGASYKEKHVGTFGDIGVFSFNVHKTIQCGEGGLCVTNDDEIAQRLQMIRNHGEAVVEAASYENIENIVGYNFRLTELQAAVARAQLQKLPDLNAARISMVEKFYKGIEAFECLEAPVAPDRVSTYYVCPVRYLQDKCGGTPRSEFVSALAAEGIIFMEGYMKPLYLLPLFQRKTALTHGYPWSAPENQGSDVSYDKGICPVTEELYEKEMLLNLFLCHPQTEADVDDILEGLKKVIEACCQ